MYMYIYVYVCVDRLHFKMFLFGQRYDAPRLWSAVRWDRELHSSMYYYTKDNQENAFVSSDDDDSDDDDSDDSDSDDSDNNHYKAKKSSQLSRQEGRRMAAKRWKWWSRNVPMALQGSGNDTILPLGTTCKTRSTLYHHLLHYKFRLLLKVRDKVNTTTHTYLYIFVYVYVYLYSFIHAYIYIYIYVRTCICLDFLDSFTHYYLVIAYSCTFAMAMSMKSFEIRNSWIQRRNGSNRC